MLSTLNMFWAEYGLSICCTFAILAMCRLVTFIYQALHKVTLSFDSHFIELKDFHTAAFFEVTENNRCTVQAIRKEIGRVEELESGIQAMRETLCTSLTSMSNAFEGHARMLLTEVETRQNNFLKALDDNYLSKMGYFTNSSDSPSESDDDCSQPLVFHWKVPEIREKMQLLKDRFIDVTSEVDFVVRNGIRLLPTLITCLGNDSVMLRLYFVNDKMDDVDSLPFLHTRRYVLVDQSSEEPKEDMEWLDRPRFRQNSEENMTASHFNYFQLCTSDFLMRDSKYVRNDEILIRIELQPISCLTGRITTTDGSHIWVIDGYAKMKRDEIAGGKLWHNSNPFKTSAEGYTMHIVLSLTNGRRGKGKCISVFLQLILGEHDDALPLPFRCRFSFRLLDKSGAKVHVCRVNEDCEVTQQQLDCGFGDFALQTVVEGPKYLKNDSIVILTEVKLL